MARKSIALMMLLTVAAWSVITLAPLLAMHMGSSQAQVVAQHEAEHHHHHAVATHACCPKLHPVPVPAVELVASSVPCEDTHRCCFRQAPSGTPTPARGNVGHSPVATSREASGLFSPALATYPATAAAGSSESPPSQLSMILRV